MRIVQLVPGVGGSFYCENCLRDRSLIQALHKMGHPSSVVPLYLPLVIEEGAGGDLMPIFFGGINVYLQEKLPFFHRLPRWLRGLLDAPWLLRRVADRATMTTAELLGKTTLSMLQGDSGRQKWELERLVSFLAEHDRPDVVVLSNLLLVGMAGAIRRRLGAKVLVMLQDEDIFLDELSEKYRLGCHQAILARAAHVDGFIAVSEYYRDATIRRYGLDSSRVHIVRTGLSLTGYESRYPPARPCIGYLDRCCPEKGADLLVEAFILLAKSNRVPGLKLRFAGGWTAADEPFMARLRQRIEKAGVADRVEFLPDLSPEDKLAFLQSLSVLSVPSRHAEAFGLYILEALGNGVPLVLPDRGAFAELLGLTGGGVLCEPDDPASLAQGLETLLLDVPRAKQLGQNGQAVVRRQFTIEHMAQEFLDLCERLAKSKQ